LQLPIEPQGQSTLAPSDAPGGEAPPFEDTLIDETEDLYLPPEQLQAKRSFYLTDFKNRLLKKPRSNGRTILNRLRERI